MLKLFNYDVGDNIHTTYYYMQQVVYADTCMLSVPIFFKIFSTSTFPLGPIQHCVPWVPPPLAGLQQLF